MNSQDTLISVIVPVYRVEQYLDRCIESIVRQTFRNLEIILIDDGSPGRCPEICDRWAKKDTRITVIHQENRGVSAARNAGIAVARGAYVGFIDSDDYVRPEYFETLYTLLVSCHAQMSLCCHSFVDEDGFLIPKSLLRHSHPPGVYSGRELLLQGLVFRAWGTLLTAGLCRKASFPEDRFIGEDFLYISHLIVDCDTVAVTNKKLYMYTQRSKSATGRISQCVDEKALAEQISLYEEMYLLFKSRNLPTQAFQVLYGAYSTLLHPVRRGYYFKNNNYRIINRQMRVLLGKTIRLEKAKSFIFFLRVIIRYLKRTAYPFLKRRLAWHFRTVKRLFSSKL